MAVVRESAVFLEVWRCRLLQICGHLSGNCSLRLHGEDGDSSMSKYEGCRQPLNIFCEWHLLDSVASRCRAQ